MKLRAGAMFAAACLAAAAIPAAAQDADDNVTVVAPVTVQGERTRDAIAAFVGDISATHERDGQIARFNRRICPGVINLRPDYAQVLIDRVAQAAFMVGLNVGRPGCESNILIIVTDDSDTLVPTMMEQYGRVFERHVEYQERKHELLAEFARPGRPVRWWHLTDQVPEGDGGSRLRAAIRTDIFRVLVVVDTELVGPISLEALGDYIAMTALARVSPDADTTRFDTVLNLFADTEAGLVRPVGMTEWDRAYLQGLYAAQGNWRQTSLQEAGISWYMNRRLEEEQAAEAPEPEGEPEPERRDRRGLRTGG